MKAIINYLRNLFSKVQHDTVEIPTEKGVFNPSLPRVYYRGYIYQDNKEVGIARTLFTDDDIYYTKS